MLVGMWAVPSQPYSRHEKRRCRSRAHRSTITRLPSGASVSRSTSFRSGAFGVGAGTAHRCTRRVGGTSSHPRSARPLAAPSEFASLRQPDRFAAGASRGRYCPPLHEARWRHFVASPLRQSRFVWRKLAHPGAYAGAWLGSEYLPSSPAPASTPVCPIPPLSTSPAPRLMLLVRPR